MGSSRWSDDFYQDRQEARAKANTDAFAYDRAVKVAPRAEQKVHENMDPKGVIRESRDSAEHPESLAILVLCDVTGSMANTPKVIQKSLGSLMNLLVTKGYAEHPQILIGAVGDARSDRGSLQVGQFESGIEIDDDLGRLWLEGNGGGSGEESYQNALYFAARHTAIDCYERRGKKGYLFLIGDELPYPEVRRDEVSRLLGDSLERNLSTESVIAEAQQKYHVFMLRPQNTSHGREIGVHRRWEELLGADHVLTLSDESAVSETIALVVGLTEGRVTLGQARHDLETLPNADQAREALRAVGSLAVSEPVPPDASPTIRL